MFQKQQKQPNQEKISFYKFRCLEESITNQDIICLDLKRAVLTNNKEVFKQIIEKYSELVNFEVYNKNVRAPIFLEAIKRFDLDTVEFLVEKKANIFKKDSEGKNALMYATITKKVDILKYLISQGFLINEKDILKKTALVYAVENNYFDIVKLLFEADVKNFNESALPNKLYFKKLEEVRSYPYCLLDQDYPVVSIAAKLNNSEMVKYLIEKGFSPNEHNSYYYLTPLAYAIENNNFELAKFLVEKKADIFLEFSYDYHKIYNSFLLATKLNREEFVKYFLQFKSSAKNFKEDLLSSIKIAIQNSNFEIFKSLFLEIKKDKNIFSCLTLVANDLLSEAVTVKNNLEIVKYLVENGADVNYFSISSNVLQKAIMHQNKEIALYLIEKGANINSAGSGGWTAIFYAINFMPDIELISYLIEHGADLTRVDLSYNGILDLALDKNCPTKIIELLKENGAV